MAIIKILTKEGVVREFPYDGQLKELDGADAIKYCERTVIEEGLTIDGIIIYKPSPGHNAPTEVRASSNQ